MSSHFTDEKLSLGEIRELPKVMHLVIREALFPMYVFSVGLYF